MNALGELSLDASRHLYQKLFAGKAGKERYTTLLDLTGQPASKRQMFYFAGFFPAAEEYLQRFSELRRLLVMSVGCRPKPKMVGGRRLVGCGEQR